MYKPVPWEGLRKLLRYSFADLGSYDDLTVEEQAALTREEFEVLAAWAKRDEPMAAEFRCEHCGTNHVAELRVA